ncbi:DsbA family protein [Candidatus Cytomitobacter primus]|uniref:Thioredoxin-like fold domain-containing protein n=1 Tax=Candidatus Cytomitobacter primus TaxID=2066024 RepID=A0A5C0UF13_9PROT|nr:thioredoxin domain-containing protein [Candidatus Cytomitobacter primus]QEK38696.1 hypothetical protein FZC34_02130 [Candidatus Cytomitobacter primus]
MKLNMTFSHIIGFFSGAVTALLFAEMFCISFNPIQDQMPFIQCDKNNLIVYSSPSCRYCAKFYEKIDKLQNKKKLNIKNVDISSNLVDAMGSSIILHAKNPNKMRKHIFKTQKMWLNEEDIMLSAQNLIQICNKLESIDLERVYSKVSVLMKETRKMCSSLGHEALPTILLVKKWEGVKNIDSVLQEIEESDGMRFGSSNVC